MSADEDLYHLGAPTNRAPKPLPPLKHPVEQVAPKGVVIGPDGKWRTNIPTPPAKPLGSPWAGDNWALAGGWATPYPPGYWIALAAKTASAMMDNGELPG